MINLVSHSRLKYISQGDPAIDSEHPDFDWDRYKETGDAKHIPLREGARPSYFDLAKLSRRQFIHVYNQGNEMDRAVEAVAYGLKSCDNVVVDKPVVVRTKRSELGDRVDGDVLDQLFQRFPLMSELAQRIIEISQAHPTPAQE